MKLRISIKDLFIGSLVPNTPDVRVKGVRGRHWPEGVRLSTGSPGFNPHQENDAVIRLRQ